MTEDRTIKSLGIDVPRYIDAEISVSDVEAINRGGCESGAYMPAVTYHEALETMSQHGDAVFEDIESALGRVPTFDPDSWAGLATRYVSLAVELWAHSVEDEIESGLEAAPLLSS